MKHWSILLLVTALLTGCATAPKGGETQTEPLPEGQAGSTGKPLGQGKPGEVGAGAQTPIVQLTGEAARTQAQKLAMDAVDLLDQGKEAEAKEILKQALAYDRDNKIANSMMRQIVVDPVASLGSKSFRYSLRPGETLSIIAQRYMGDIYEFYALARYNGISVPRDVHTGQVIKVPGDEPPPPPPPKPRPTKKIERPERAEPSAPAEEPPAVEQPPAPPALPAPSPAETAYQKGLKLLKSGQKEMAYAAFQQAVKLDPEHKTARAAAEQTRQDLIQRHSRIALGAFHRQDMDTAIKEWDKVLELDPHNESARLKRQQAVELLEKIKKFPR